MNQPIVLAIETSQRTGGVALRDAEGQTHVEALDAGRKYDDALMPAIARLFDRANLQSRALHAVGVSIGPGGFSGLRIAVATVKMLAESIGVKVVAVPSALVAAAAVDAEPETRIIVALASKGDSCWAVALRRTAEAWQIEGEPGLVTAETISLRGVRYVIADEYLAEPIQMRCEKRDVAVCEPQFEAEACLQETLRRLRRDECDDPLHLKPVYPRPPEAVTLWARRRATT